MSNTLTPYVETLQSPVLGTFYAAYPDDRSDYHVVRGNIGCGPTPVAAIAALKQHRPESIAA